MTSTQVSEAAEAELVRLRAELAHVRADNERMRTAIAGYIQDAYHFPPELRTAPSQTINVTDAAFTLVAYLCANGKWQIVVHRGVVKEGANP